MAAKVSPLSKFICSCSAAGLRLRMISTASFVCRGEVFEIVKRGCGRRHPEKGGRSAHISGYCACSRRLRTPGSWNAHFVFKFAIASAAPYENATLIDRISG
jgi:hypothetical protein